MNSSPNITSDVTPDVTPDVNSDVTSDLINKLTSDLISDLTSDIKTSDVKTSNRKSASFIHPLTKESAAMGNRLVSDDDDYYKYMELNSCDCIYPFSAKSPFSRFYKCEFNTGVHNYFYSEVQYIQYKKVELFLGSGSEEASKILKTTDDPHKCESIGLNISSFEEAEWSKKKIIIAKDAVRHKYRQNMDLTKRLLLTYPKTLVEASDSLVWGVGINIDNPDIFDISKWKGFNLSGRILTLYRNMIIADKNFWEYDHYGPIAYNPKESSV